MSVTISPAGSAARRALIDRAVKYCMIAHVGADVDVGRDQGDGCGSCVGILVPSM
jgi:hypothetical protein